MILIVKNQTKDCRNAIQNFIRDKNKLNRSHDYAHYDAFKEKALLRASLLEEHLNLNHLTLMDNRSKLYNQITQIFDIRCRGKSFEQGEILRKKIVHDFIRDKDNYPKAYIGIITFLFKKYL